MFICFCLLQISFLYCSCFSASSWKFFPIDISKSKSFWLLLGRFLLIIWIFSNRYVLNFIHLCFEVLAWMLFIYLKKRLWFCYRTSLLLFGYFPFIRLLGCFFLLAFLGSWAFSWRENFFSMKNPSSMRKKFKFSLRKGV